MLDKTMLTTVDNPFDPSTQFDEWYAYDTAKGYFTCERLARIAYTSPMLSDAENDQIIDDAMDELIRTGAIDKQGNIVEYRKVVGK